MMRPLFSRVCIYLYAVVVAIMIIKDSSIFTYAAVSTTNSPTFDPTVSAAPSVSQRPSHTPTTAPTLKPTRSPTTCPSAAPTITHYPTRAPTAVPTSTPCPISLSELNALEFLYNSTNGPYWNWKKHGAIWKFPASVSDPSAYSWQGLDIVPSSGGGGGGVECEVQQLYLPNYNLSGTIPQQISALTGLTYLDLAVNKLRGQIPSEISELTNLEYLYLYTNSLTG